MSEQQPKQPGQSLNISNSVLESVQIAGNAGRDLNLTQIQGKVGAINVFGTVQVPLASINTAKPISQQEYRQRQVLLNRVKKFWIDGVLAKSLHTHFLIELGLEERSKFVQNPLSEVDKFLSNSGQSFPAGTVASDVFEGMGAGRTLLILGEPGSGKTVTLLKLTESLIARTENNLSQPLPVLLNLSSWSKQRKSIADWLVQEIHEIYHLPPSSVKAWVEQEQLTLLLDGLDEVNAKYRNDCVKALNQFIRGHGLTEMIVCSRLQDYENLSERLKLISAIYIQPLTFKQIEHYLECAGESLLALKKALNQNAKLREFASSPLILSIMSLAYQDDSLESLAQAETPEEQRHKLFETYIDRMFIYRSTTQRYSKRQALRWLIWLAQEMVLASQTVFLIERLQPDLLSSRPSKAFFRLANATIIGLIYGLFISFTAELIDILISSLIYGLVQNLIDSSTFALIDSLISEQLITLDYMVAVPFVSSLIGFIVGFLEALIYGLIAGTAGTIKIVEKVKWSWQEMRKGYSNGLQFGFTIGSIGIIFLSLVGILIAVVVFTDEIGHVSIDSFKFLIDQPFWIEFLTIILLTSFLSGLIWLVAKLIIFFITWNSKSRNRDNVKQNLKSEIIWKKVKNFL